MSRILIVFVCCCVLFSGCSPKVNTTITNKSPVLGYKDEIVVFGLTDSYPAGEEVGVIRVTDSGFSINCSYEKVIEKVKLEARKLGGNVIKITNHQPPNIASTCHRITATIFFATNMEPVLQSGPTKTLGDVNYAILHVYRPKGLGPLVGYDLYLGDSLICRVKNNSKFSIKINKDGRNMLWAKTESRADVPVNIEFGYEYYLRCSLSIGIMVGRPVLELMNEEIGRSELQSIKARK